VRLIAIGFSSSLKGILLSTLRSQEPGFCAAAAGKLGLHLVPRAA
jgi:hypothetical protein